MQIHLFLKWADTNGLLLSSGLRKQKWLKVIVLGISKVKKSHKFTYIYPMKIFVI